MKGLIDKSVKTRFEALVFKMSSSRADLQICNTRERCKTLCSKFQGQQRIQGLVHGLVSKSLTQVRVEVLSVLHAILGPRSTGTQRSQGVLWLQLVQDRMQSRCLKSFCGPHQVSNTARRNHASGPSGRGCHLLLTLEQKHHSSHLNRGAVS